MDFKSSTMTHRLIAAGGRRNARWRDSIPASYQIWSKFDESGGVLTNCSPAFTTLPVLYQFFAGKNQDASLDGLHSR